MKIFGRHTRIFAILLLSAFSFSFSLGFDASVKQGFRYGPNLSWSVMGNAPFVWGQWLPQLEGTVRYTWLEPIGLLDYGAPMEKSPTYLRMEGAVELSPFFAGYEAGLGLRPFKTNPQVEVGAIYRSYLYLLSNQEMVTVDALEGGRIAETWNADYIVDNVWGDDDEFDYAQLFDFYVKIEYFLPRYSFIGFNMHYILSDISTDFDGKSYDYKINMPVFSRDFVLDFELYGMFSINKNIAALFETSYYRTGTLRNGNTVEKESLSYMMAKVGPHFTWADGMQSLTFEIGFWKRREDSFYDGSLAQEFIAQLKYQGYFSFPIHQKAL